MMIGTVELAWPDRRLHPNSRVSRHPKATAVKQARRDAGWAAVEAGLRSLTADALRVTVTFHPPDRRKRDIDGMLANIKAHLDGIADVVDVDDSRWDLHIARGEVVPGGKVLVEVEEA